MRGRKPIMLYDLYNGNKMQGKYSAAELAQRFGCSKSKIYSVVATSGQIGEYYLDNGIPEGFAQKWNQAVEVLKRVLEKERQNEMLIPCGVMDCFANSDGQCSCLTDNHFKDGCPFFKPRDNELEES